MSSKLDNPDTAPKTYYRKYLNLVRTKKQLFSRVCTIIRLKKNITKKSAH